MNDQSNLPHSPTPELTHSKEAWRVFGIMSEFVAATQRLSDIHPAVSIFGSARTPHDHPYYSSPRKLHGCCPMPVSR